MPKLLETDVSTTFTECLRKKVGKCCYQSKDKAVATHALYLLFKKHTKETYKPLRKYPVLTELWKIADLKKSTYYEALEAATNSPNKEKAILLARITEAIVKYCTDNHHIYGCRRILHKIKHDEKLKELNGGVAIKICKETILEIMKREGVECRSKFNKKRSRRRVSRREFDDKNTADNHTNKDFRTQAPGQKLFTDITYGEITEEKGITHAYVCTIIDGFNNEVVAVEIQRTQDINLVLSCIKQAYEKGLINKNTIFHSDQGPQFKAHKVVNNLTSKGAIRSMSAKGACNENGLQEGFFSRMKNEMICMPNYSNKTFEEFKASVLDYVHYYNHERITSYCDYMSPVKYRLAFMAGKLPHQSNG